MSPILSNILIAILAATQSAVLESAGSTSQSTACTDVYLISHPLLIGRFNESMIEISTSADATPAQVRGKLFRGDWGAFSTCGKSLTLRIRYLIDPSAVKGPRISSVKDDIVVSLQNRKAVYLQVGNKKGELDPAQGQKAIADIESGLGKRAPAGWEWIDQRDLYYGKGSKCALERSERCP